MLAALTVGLLLGALLSAMVLWLFSGLLSPVPPEWRHAAIVAAAVLALLRDAGVLRFPMPQNARQIPQDVLQRDLMRGTLQFGFELGTGVRTYVSASAPYVIALGVLLTGGPVATPIAVGLGFALGRALSPVTRLASGDVQDWDARLAHRLTPMKVTICAAMVVALTVSHAQ
ncbi:hypothetical protein E0L36_03865 [Streptomyces sp. AJS327]|uniref:hypothetical protein n=1 Tax=Streptomyces sp. AJS327 TaxID=2545265 RepID=UPI0015E050DE|nr:hypothetical protein [Streptomyces sp. AJS327]MBA0050066.1 hypothetical protein [Streptomyces sp. AJS327]